MSSAVSADPVRIMQQEIAKLRLLNEPTNEDAEMIRKVVYTLEEIVCQIDYAHDFCKLGGLQEVLRLLVSNIRFLGCIDMLAKSTCNKMLTKI